MKDRFGREFTYLRVSVTDRCNLYCIYCKVPELPRPERMTLPEIARIVRAAADVGVRKIRLTGGEPTLRSDIVEITEAVAATPGIRQIVMTTNGLLLGRLAAPLAKAGLQRVNVSCDSLDAENFRNITKGGILQKVLDGLDAARAAGLVVKINCVVMGNQNDHEVLPMLQFSIARDFDIRFIEYMPMNLGEGEGLYGAPETIPSAQLRDHVAKTYKLIPEESSATSGPADTYHVVGTRTRVGFISAMSNPFCENCNRLRVTPEGKIRSCLLTGGDFDLVGAIRAGASDADLSKLYLQALEGKPAVYELHKFGAVDMRSIGG
ncbi:MAG: GTP 3',8-cyclase MoaA [Planctomycetes bacterium]|nr:GTP 3',8-cyclase MoaA [Planctomycetota bacterium]